MLASQKKIKDKHQKIDTEIHCLDDDVFNILGKEEDGMANLKKKLDIADTFNYGDYFGTIDVGENEISNEFFYLTDSACQFGIITQEFKAYATMEEYDPEIAEKLKKNILLIAKNKNKLIPIEELNESGVSEKKYRGNRSLERQKTFVPDFLSPKSTNNMEQSYMTNHIQKIDYEIPIIKSMLSDILERLKTQPTMTRKEVMQSQQQKKSKETAPILINDAETNDGDSGSKKEEKEHHVDNLLKQLDDIISPNSGNKAKSMNKIPGDTLNRTSKKKFTVSYEKP